MNIQDYMEVRKCAQSDGIVYDTVVMKSTNIFLRDWFLIDHPKKLNIEGVYMISDFYIGVSQCIRTRVIRHAQQAILGKHYNKKFQEKINFHFENGVPMDLMILSRNKKDEGRLIEEYKPSLVNIGHGLKL